MRCGECKSDTLIGLVERSENRIDRTNEMISKCVSIIDRVTTEYTTQLDELQKNRDALVDENKRLISLLEESKKDYDILNKKYDSLIDKMISMSSQRSENNINVK